MITEDNKIGLDCDIAKEAEIHGCTLGNHVYVDKYTRIYNSFIGDKVRFEQSNQIIHSEMGRFCYTGAGTHIKNVTMGAFNSISWNVSIGGNTHDLNHLTTHSFLVYPKWEMGGTGNWASYSDPCVLGNDIWVGSNANILRGVTIGDGAVIGGSCVITKDVPPYAIMVGNPGRILRYRCKEELIPELLKLKWWELPEAVIKEHFDLFKGELTLDVIKKVQEIKDSL